LAWDGAKLRRIDLHLARLAQGAQALGYPCDSAAAHLALQNAGQNVGQSARLRLTLGALGDIEVTTSPLPPAKAVWHIGLASQRLNSRDPFLQVKSTHRPAYDAARAALPAGLDEVILLNERGEVADGSITTLFFDQGQGLRTPPLSSGALPGVLRSEIAAPEQVLQAQDTARAQLWVGNSVRGLIPAIWMQSSHHNGSPIRRAKG
jgi:4-amino-4-deoxychorismate lyase